MRVGWKQRRYLASVSLIAALVAALMVAPVAARAARPSGGIVANVTGTVSGLLSNGTAVPEGSTFVGTFTVASFQAVDNQIVAVGTLVGTVRDADDNVLQSVNTLITAADGLLVTPTSGSCQILELTLGPLDLNLLGLVIELDQVHLEITAQQGPGNLLGNLLCAVANLLNPGGGLQNALQQIVNLLNQILGAL